MLTEGLIAHMMEEGDFKDSQVLYQFELKDKTSSLLTRRSRERSATERIRSKSSGKAKDRERKSKLDKISSRSLRVRDKELLPLILDDKTPSVVPRRSSLSDSPRSSISSEGTLGIPPLRVTSISKSLTKM